MAKLDVTDEQLGVIQTALEHYARIGIGQFNFITEHPTFDNFLYNELKNEDGETDWTKYHQIMTKVETALTYPRNLLINDMSMPGHGSWGVLHPDVDESCWIAFDIMQVIRHARWKINPNKKYETVDSSVHFTSKGSEKEKVEL